MTAFHLLAVCLLALVAAQEEQPEDVCTLPPVSGMCMAYFPSYFYNSTSKKCEYFVYGGCQGNGNRFWSLEDCRSKCDRCYQPKVVGMCKASFASFFYNSESGRCESFVYGGCNGNGNRFDTVEQCRDACETPIKASCSLPPSPGGCWGNNLLRIFFNSTSGQCEPFSYRGCGGNDNNFETVQACETLCLE